MANILTAAEAAEVLRCLTTDPLMLSLLPSVDAYIKQATGHDWAADSTIEPMAKSAARILVTLWHENPAMIGNATGSLPAGLSACLTQLEALALRYMIFEGLSGVGSIVLPGAHEGDTVTTLIGVVGISGDQSAKFESIITIDGMIQQTSSSNLEDKFFRALLTPPS